MMVLEVTYPRDGGCVGCATENMELSACRRQLENFLFKGKSMFKKTIIVGVSVVSVAFAVAAFAGNGAETMVLKGGSTGDVPFTHKKHQDALKDCEVCHKLFPKEAGAIEKAIAAGTMKKKDIMKQCTDCHKDAKAKGAAAGPTGCKDCHSKK
jgi:c(7)-type cytochrome triheme protein